MYSFQMSRQIVITIVLYEHLLHLYESIAYRKHPRMTKVSKGAILYIQMFKFAHAQTHACGRGGGRTHARLSNARTRRRTHARTHEQRTNARGGGRTHSRMSNARTHEPRTHAWSIFSVKAMKCIELCVLY